MLCRTFGAAGGGGDRIVKRAQQPGDIAQRARLGAPLFQRTRRLALEIDDIGVARRDQHLARDENRRGCASSTCPSAFGQLRRSRRPTPRAARSSAAAAARHSSSGQSRDARQRGKGASSCARTPLAQSATSPLRRLLWREIRVVGRRRQHRVQLGQTPADRGGEIARSRRAHRSMSVDLRRRGRRPPWNSSTRDRIIERPAPAVALVAHKTLHEHQRVRRAVGIVSRHLAQAAARCWRSRARSDSGPSRLRDGCRGRYGAPA